VAHLSTMLTDLEAVFRSLKSELGLRPVYHHKTGRVDAHLFISVLAYHFVHTLRFQLKSQGIHLSWEGIRRQLDGQDRVTVVLRRDDGKVYHIRKTHTPRAPPADHLGCLGAPPLPGFHSEDTHRFKRGTAIANGKGRRNRLKGACGRGTLQKEKPPIFGMIERGGQVVIRMLENVRQKTIQPLIEQTILPGTLVLTDE